MLQRHYTTDGGALLGSARHTHCDYANIDHSPLDMLIWVTHERNNPCEKYNPLEENAVDYSYTFRGKLRLLKEMCRNDADGVRSPLHCRHLKKIGAYTPSIQQQGASH